MKLLLAALLLLPSAAFRPLPHLPSPSLTPSPALRVRGGASLDPLPFRGLDLTSVKVLLATALTALNALCWAVPLANRKFSQNQEALGLANCFSGGIFLSLSLGHLIPEAIEAMHEQGSPASLALWFALAGYIAVFLVDKVAFDTHAACGHDHGGFMESTETAVKAGTSPMGAVILVGALCVHSLFETLALGVSSSQAAATMLSASIGLHQPAESLALLVALLKSGLTHKTIVRLLCIFTAVAPLGCALGIAAHGLDMPMLDSALAAVAAGTFIYVGCNEVVAEEFEGGTTAERWKKFACFLGGVGSIALMSRVSEGWHGHAGHSH